MRVHARVEQVLAETGLSFIGLGLRALFVDHIAVGQGLIETVLLLLSVRKMASSMSEMSHLSMNTCALKSVPPFWRMNLPAFEALATTSAGAAWAMGYADGQTPREAMLATLEGLNLATAHFIAEARRAGHAIIPLAWTMAQPAGAPAGSRITPSGHR